MWDLLRCNECRASHAQGVGSLRPDSVQYDFTDE